MCKVVKSPLEGDSTYRHVVAGSDKGVGDRVHKLPRDAKVTDFDHSCRVDKDVGWLEI